jgi:hypothetical protein
MTWPVVTWTRPNDTTPYTAGDVVGSATSAVIEAPVAAPPGGRILIQSAELVINRTTVPSGMTTSRLHLWSGARSAILDNAAFAAAAADRVFYAGSIALPAPTVIGGGFLWSFGDYAGRPIKLDPGLQGLRFNLITDAGFTPAALTEYSVRFHGIVLPL